MPIYVYGCLDCGAVEEHIQRFSDPPKSRCEACGGKLEKKVTSAAFHLKGAGWYRDGYASARPDGDGGGAGSDAGEAATSGKTDGGADSGSGGGGDTAPASGGATPKSSTGSTGSTGGKSKKSAKKKTKATA